MKNAFLCGSDMRHVVILVLMVFSVLQTDMYQFFS